MSKHALRYTSEAEMPAGMRRLYQANKTHGLELAVAFQVPDDAVREIEPAHGRKVAKKLGIGRKSKFGAIPTTVDGIRFDSLKESRYYRTLLLRVAGGEVLYFLRQVPIHLPGGTKLVVDFQEFHADGSVHYVDVKGRETPVFRLKKREVEHLYPHLRIELA